MKRYALTPARRRDAALLAAALAAALCACACRTPAGHAFPALLDVPFVEQAGVDDCGAATLAMLLLFYGYDPDVGVLRRELTIPALGGTIPELIAVAAEDRGFDAFIQAGDPLAPEDGLSNARPSIILLGADKDSGEPGHFVVVTGARRGAFRVHDGARSNAWVKSSHLRNRWRAADYLTFWIAPRRPGAGAAAGFGSE